MDTFENSEFPSDMEDPQPASEEVTPPQPQDVPQQSAYYGAGVGRKESPYAASPYVINREQEEYHYQPQTQPPQKPQKERKRRTPIWKRIASFILMTALVACGCLITASYVNEYWEERTEDTVQMLTTKIDDLQKQIDSAAVSGGQTVQLPTGDAAMTPSQLYRYSVDSVVAISSTIQTTSFYGSSTASSSGSGFILSEDGYVVTNYHVVEGATAVDVILHDGTEYPAEVTGFDSTNDIAVLKIDATGLSAATLGSSDDLIIGDMVVAIGNPLGELTATQTVG